MKSWRNFDVGQVISEVLQSYHVAVEEKVVAQSSALMVGQ